MITIDLHKQVGSFAENKDMAREIRLSQIDPVLSNGDEVQLDFDGITLATQSFIHALISDLIRSHGINVLDRMIFQNCCNAVATLINVVCDYMQDGLPIDD